MKHRVVVTGLGVCAPNGVGLVAFSKSLEDGVSGIRFIEELSELKFSCQIAGLPDVTDIDLTKYFTSVQLRSLNATGLVYGAIAGLDAWQDAGLQMGEGD